MQRSSLRTSVTPVHQDVVFAEENWKKQVTGDDAGLEYNNTSSLIFKMLVGDLRKTLSELGFFNKGKKQ